MLFRSRLGMLVDLAHCSPDFVDAAMAGSDAAMVWSHSWVRGRGSSWRDWPYIARAVSQEQARRFAARGGVIGLWTARVLSDRSYQVRDADSYADEIARLADLLEPGLGVNDLALAERHDLRTQTQVCSGLKACGLENLFLCAAFLQAKLELVEQKMLVNRLEHIVGHSGVDCLTDIEPMPLAGEHQDGNLPVFGIFANGTREVET